MGHQTKISSITKILLILFIAMIFKVELANAQVQLMKDFYPDGEGSVRYIYKTGSNVFYLSILKPEEFAFELWVSDGTEAGTRMVKKFKKIGSKAEDEDYAYLNGKFYFHAVGLNEENSFVYVTDGTETGTKPLHDELTARSDPGKFNVFGDYVYFQSRTSIAEPYHWFKTDGTTVTKVTTGSNGFFIYYNMTQIDGVIYFVGNGDLYKYDGDTVTNVWEELGHADNGYEIVSNKFTSFDDKIVFYGINDVDGKGVHIFDPETGDIETLSTIHITVPLSGDRAEEQFFQEKDGWLYFILTSPDYSTSFDDFGPKKNALWKTDGTTESTVEIYEFSEDTASTNIIAPIQIQGSTDTHLFLQGALADEGYYDDELFSFNYATEKVTLLHEFETTFWPDAMVKNSTKLHFFSDYVEGSYPSTVLYTTDGTAGNIVEHPLTLGGKKYGISDNGSALVRDSLFYVVGGLEGGTGSDVMVYNTNNSSTVNNNDDNKPGIVKLVSPENGIASQPVDNSFLWERQMLATNYQVQIASNNEFSTTFFDSTFTDTSATVTGLDNNQIYYWRVRAINEEAESNGEWSEVFSFTTKSATLASEVTANVTLSFGSAEDPSDYRLVALPGQANVGLDDLLTGQQGVDWQAFYDNGSEEDYLVKYDGSEKFTIKPGNGFWVTSKNQLTYSDTLSAIELSSENQAVVTLHEGWNIISNPLDIDVEWSEISSVNNETLQPVWSFDGSFTESDNFRSAKSGEAFYFFNDQELEELAIPYAASSGSEKDKTGKERQEVHVLTTVDEKQTSASSIVFGKSLKSMNDVIAPPSGFERATLRFIVDHKSKRASYLSRLYRNIQGHGQSYRVVLKGAPGESVRIMAETHGMDRYPYVYLIDEKTSRQFNLKRRSGVRFVPDKETTKLLLVVGDGNYIDQQKIESLPKKIQIKPNYPNPFNPATTLSFALPKQTTVRLEIFNMLGRKVATLLDNEVIPAGVHKVRFDASQQASGMYFAVYQIGNQNYYEKLTLIK